MRRSWLAVILAAACGAPCHAHSPSGGFDHPTVFPAMAIPLLDRDRQPHGRVRVQLTVEAGAFFVASPGRLRAYSHRYRYTIGNLASMDGPPDILTQFTPLFCPTGAVLEPATLMAGDGDDASWSANLMVSGTISLAQWTAAQEGALPGSRWSFMLYTNAEPERGFILLDGQYLSEASGAMEIERAEPSYWVPGCQAETPADVPELDWTSSVDATVSSAGHVLTYRLKAVNVGAGEAGDLVIVDALPSAVTYLPGTTTLNGDPVADPSPGVSPLAGGLTVPELAPGASATVRFRVRVRPGQETGVVIENTASLTTAQTPPLDTVPARTTLLPPDTTPPAITIASPIQPSYAKSESDAPALVPLRFTIADAEPGLDPATAAATLDGSPVQSGRSVDLFALLPGPHTLRIRAGDWAGNLAEREVSFTVVPTFTSTIYEVWRMQRQGWIRRQRTAESLNQLLIVAQQRIQVGNREGALMSLRAFLATVQNPRRITPDLSSMTDQACAQLAATVRYLVERM